MKTELADGDASDSESLSWHMDSLLKAVAVSLVYERARAILKLQQNLRIYPHSVVRADQKWRMSKRHRWIDLIKEKLEAEAE
jgi:hypothetical protein